MWFFIYYIYKYIYIIVSLPKGTEVIASQCRHPPDLLKLIVLLLELLHTLGIFRHTSLRRLRIWFRVSLWRLLHVRDWIKHLVSMGPRNGWSADHFRVFDPLFGGIILRQPMSVVVIPKLENTQKKKSQQITTWWSLIIGQPSNMLVSPTHHLGTDLHVCATWICPELGYTAKFKIALHWRELLLATGLWSTLYFGKIPNRIKQIQAICFHSHDAKGK